MEDKLPLMKGLISSFSIIEDTRVDRTKLYPLNEILFLCICAIVSGFEDWDGIADFGESKLDWLRKYLPYKHGIPSHDTINRVVSMIDYRVFEKCFIDWATMDISLPNGTIIHIDGKSIRGSSSKKEYQTARSDGGKPPKHIVNAFCNELEICLGQYQVEDKSNEIVAIPTLLELLELQGCIITIDAIGCQKKIAEQIVNKKADYIIGVKNNQKYFLSSMKETFQNYDNLQIPMNQSEQRGKNHGRVESRICDVISVAHMAQNSGKDNWMGLKTIIRITSERKIMATQKIEKEQRYYISSSELDADEFNRIVRSHWSIENKLHWTLDVVFGEDTSRKRAGNAAANVSTLRKMAFNLLKTAPQKMSMNRKRNKCAFYDEFREKVLKMDV